MRRAWWRWAWAVALWAGCQWSEGARQALVEDHRAQAQGRVGVLRGLEVHQRAAELTRARALRGDDACGELPDAFSARLTLRATLRDGAGALLAQMREERDVEVDAERNARVKHAVALRDPSGREGSWAREERIVGERHFVQEENLPYSARRARPSSRADLLRRALDPIPSALASVGQGWRSAPDAPHTYEATGTTGGRALRCGLSPKDEPWLGRLAKEARLEQATAGLHGGRSFSGRWVGGGPGAGWTLDLDIEEQIQHGPAPTLEAPTVGPSVERDRPYRDIRAILEDRLGIAQGAAP